MATVKVVLRTDKTNSKGEHPLYLRLTRNRRSSYTSLDIHLRPDLWDIKKQLIKRGHPSYQQINAYLNEKVNCAFQFMLSRQDLNMTLKEAIKGKNSGSLLSGIYFFKVVFEGEKKQEGRLTIVK